MAHLSVKLRLLILALIDSLIVTFSVFVSYYILEPYFKTYSVKLLILAAYHYSYRIIFQHLFLICIIERGNMPV
ncbi:UDP-D-quinovosamine 4-dehydrogenase [Staphylococcus aureus]|nr:UDP-D-quinovosamine 4-dehydrogenase [Staphylococcus aureus]